MAGEFKEPLRFNDSVASLQHLTHYKVALILVNSYISRTPYYEAVNSHGRYGVKCNRNECNDLVNSLELPQSIKGIIRRCYNELWKEIDKWAWYMTYDLFDSYLVLYRVNRLNLNYLSWFQNGYVDYKQTAKNMILGSELNVVQKFAIMSRFCLVDYIRSFSLCMLPSYFVNQVWPADQFLISYWIRYLKNELHLIPLAAENVSIEYTLAKKCNSFNWFAFEYFWNQLCIEEQIGIAKFKLADYTQNMDQYYAELLSKMPCYHQRQLLSEIFVDVMFSFLIRLNQPELALKTWIGIRELCTIDQFRELLQRLLPNVIQSEKNMELFCEIWTITPVRIKNYFVVHNGSEFIKSFRGEKHSPSCFKLLHQFLSVKSPNSRQELLRNLANEIVPLFGSSAVIINVIKFCFPDAREQIEFKNFVLNSNDARKHLARLLNEHKFGTFVDILKVYLPDAIVTQKYLQQILMSDEIDKYHFLHVFDNWLKLSHCIDQLLPDSSSMTFKMQLLLSFLNNNQLRTIHVLGYTDEVAKIVDNVFMVAPEKASDLKQTWINFFRTNILTDVQYLKSFNEQKCQNFVSWCLNCAQNDVRVDEFKKTFLFEDILQIILTNVHVEMWQSDAINCISKCLKWYYTDVEERKKFVIRVMHQLNEASVVGSIEKSRYVKLASFLKRIFELIDR